MSEHNEKNEVANEEETVVISENVASAIARRVDSIINEFVEVINKHEVDKIHTESGVDVNAYTMMVLASTFTANIIMAVHKNGGDTIKLVENHITALTGTLNQLEDMEAKSKAGIKESPDAASIEVAESGIL